MRVRALAAAVLLACGAGAPSDTLPPELVRTWRTNAPAYRDRSFELRSDWVIFGTGNYTTSMHPIEHVRLTPQGSTTLVEIGYRTEDEAVLQIQLEWTPGSPDRLRIGRRSDVWVPESDAHWLREKS